MVDTIEGSFRYRYNGTEREEINGRYKLTILLKTDQWEKKYVIVTEKNFTFYEKTSSFNFSFPVNLSFYESIIEQINTEIGMKAQNPRLILTCDIFLSSHTSKGSIYERFSPSVNIEIEDYLLKFTGDLIQYDTGNLTEEKEIFQQQVKNNRYIWTSISIGFFVILVFFGFGTEHIDKKECPEEILVRKIKKKYAEWLIEVKNLPTAVQNSERIFLKSFEDLNRVGENLGKPLLFNESECNGIVKQSFYVIDNSTVYEYSLEYNK